MLSWLLLVTIGLPWLGAACIWLVGDRHPRSLHVLATIFAVVSGLAALGMLPLASSAAAVRIPIGGILGDFTLVPDGLGVLIAVIATVVGSLAVIFSINYMHARRGTTGPLLRPDPVLHRRHGRPGSLGQPVVHLHLLGDHRLLFVCADLVP